MVAEHLLWLQQRYWRSRYSVSFPRASLRRRH
jgi:2-iminoacetate synthase